MRHPPWLLLPLIFASCAPNCALSQHPNEEALIHQEGQTVPDELYLLSFLRLLEVRFAYRFDGDLDRLASHVSDEMFLHDVEEGAETAAYLRLVTVEMAREKALREHEMFCDPALFNSGQSNASGQSDFFAARNEFGAESAAIGRKYLQRIENEFGEYKFRKFLSWIERRKATSIVVAIDHERMGRGQDPELARQAHCRGLEKTLSGTWGRN